MEGVTPGRLRRGLARRAWRTLKFVRLRWRGWTGRGARTSVPAFVWGCHRSGTKMLLRTLDRCLDTWTYPEHNRRAFDSGYRLRPLSRVDELVRESPASVVAFKPICDSHRADLLLDHFEEREPRGLWIYRDPDDVTNSLVRKWGDQFARVVRAILDGRRDEVGWRGERIGEGRLRELAELAPGELTPEDGAALFWWLRNSFYFDLGLDGDARVRLVSYEALVNAPTAYLPPVFEFVGIPFEPEFADSIHAGAVGRDPEPRLAEPVRAACAEMTGRLDEAHPGEGRP